MIRDKRSKAQGRCHTQMLCWMFWVTRAVQIAFSWALTRNQQRSPAPMHFPLTLAAALSCFSFLLSGWHFLASLAVLNSIAIHCHRCWGHKNKWHTVCAMHFFSECMGMDVLPKNSAGGHWVLVWMQRRWYVSSAPFLGAKWKRWACLNRSGHGMNRRWTSLADAELDSVWMSGQFCKSGSSLSSSRCPDHQRQSECCGQWVKAGEVGRLV